jgi:hypothetical protein
MENIKPEIIAGEAMLRDWPRVTEFSLIGSAMYLPAESCGDVDFAVLVGDGTSYVDHIAELIADHGFQACGEQYECATGTWGAARRGNLNLIVTHDRAFYDGYKLAMEVCAALRLTDKKDRIAACKVVRDRMPASKVRAEIYGDLS